MHHLQGLTTMVLTAADVDTAADWYSRALGVAPYSAARSRACRICRPASGPDQSELGIMNRAYAPAATTGAGASTTYWQVDDVEATLTELVTRGAQVQAPATERGGGFTTGFRPRPIQQRHRADATAPTRAGPSTSRVAPRSRVSVAGFAAVTTQPR